jgi:hypothetical protein
MAMYSLAMLVEIRRLLVEHADAQIAYEAVALVDLQEFIASSSYSAAILSELQGALGLDYGTAVVADLVRTVAGLEQSTDYEEAILAELEDILETDYVPTMGELREWHQDAVITGQDLSVRQKIIGYADALSKSSGQSRNEVAYSYRSAERVALPDGEYQKMVAMMNKSRQLRERSGVIIPRIECLRQLESQDLQRRAAAERQADERSRSGGDER